MNKTKREIEDVAHTLGDGFTWRAKDPTCTGDAIPFRLTDEYYDTGDGYSKAITAISVHDGKFDIEISDLSVVPDENGEEGWTFPGEDYINPHKAKVNEIEPEEWVEEIIPQIKERFKSRIDEVVSGSLSNAERTNINNERQKDTKHTLPADFPELRRGDVVRFTHPVFLDGEPYRVLTNDDRISVHNDEDDIVRKEDNKDPLYHYILFSNNGINAARVSDLTDADTEALAAAIRLQWKKNAAIKDKLAVFGKYIPAGKSDVIISFPLDNKFRGVSMNDGRSMRSVSISRGTSRDGSVTGMLLEYLDNGLVRQKEATEFTEEEWKAIGAAVEEQTRKERNRPIEMAPSRRWHHSESTKEMEAYGEMGRLLALFSFNRGGNDSIHVYDYVHWGSPENNLILSIYAEMEYQGRQIFLSEDEMKKYGMAPKPFAPSVPVVIAAADGRKVIDIYDFSDTYLVSGSHKGETGKVPPELSRKNEESGILSRSKIENLVASGNWPAPVHYAGERERKVLESYPSRSAFYDFDGGMRGHKAVYVLSPGDDDRSDDRRKMDILDALSRSIIDPVSGFLDRHPEYDDNRYNVTHFMNAIRYDINLNDADATRDYRRHPFSHTDRLHSDPAYVRELLTKSSMVSQLIADRANGIVYNLHEGERVTEEKGSQKETEAQVQNISLSDQDEVSKENEQESQERERPRGLHF